MGDLTTYNDIVLPTAWDIKDKLPFIDIDSSGLKVNYTNPDEFKSAIVRANHPIPSQCGMFYFEIKILNRGKNGMIGIGFCTKQSDKRIDDSAYINNMLMPGQEYKKNKETKENEQNKDNETWGCGYHGDDGYSFCSGSGVPYGSLRSPGYTTGDTIGCYLNFRNNIVFYTKNGINLGIACHLNSNFKGMLYPCVGFRSQGGSIEVNFGNKGFKYFAMTNEDIKKTTNNALSLEYQEKDCFIMSGYENTLVNLTDELTKSLKKKPNNAFELSYRGKLFFIIGKYDESFEDLTRLLEIEPENISALKYRSENNYMMKRYNESIADLRKLLEIKPNDTWATKVLELVNELLKKEFCNWTSDNHDIDQLIKQIQLNAMKYKDIIEWIPFSKFANIKYLAKGGFGTVFKAVWIDGYITGLDQKNEWKRSPQIDVCLKSIDNSEYIKQEFLEEVKNQHEHGGNSAIAIYGVTKNPKDGNYMIVMEYAKQGSLRKLLDSKYGELNWASKVANLYYIASGLNTIHDAKLVHKDFHSGNIVNQNMYSSYITDFGLCRPVSKDSELFGVIPYIAPEVLYTNGKEYTQKSDIYSFGIIMSEVFTGYPPYHDIPHNEDLAMRICLGYRPKIRCEVPQLLLDLMNKCIDAEPQNRPTAKELSKSLYYFFGDLKNEESKLYKQVKNIKNLDKKFLTYDQVKYQTHPQAIYTSRSLKLSKLSKPVNAVISRLIDFEIPDDQ